MKVLIIGGVAAGAAAATRLRRENDKANITIFEKSSKISFSNCALPYGIGGTVDTEILAPKNFKSMEAKGIKVKVNHEVLSINESKKSVKVKDLKTGKLKTYIFDKLIVATGARALKLPIEGLDKEKNVFSLRTYDDMKNIIKNLNNKKNALIIGGGFIGVEIAEQLRAKKVNVHLVEMRAKLAGFDYDFSSFLENELTKNKVKVHIDRTVESIDAKKKEFTTKDGSFKYDIIITTGITPNTEIFNGTSIKVDRKGLVKTNKYMQTKNKDIYAAGDITYSKHVVTNKDIYMPMARMANSQGRVAADHIAGVKTKGKIKTTGTSGFVVFGKTFAKSGLSEAAAKAMKFNPRVVMATVAVKPGYVASEKVVMKMMFEEKDGKLLGIQAFGPSADKIADTFSVAITAGMKIVDLAELNLVYQPHISTTVNPLNTIAQVALNENRLGFTSECPFKVVHGEEEKNNLIIDIRSPEQHKVSHLDGAVNIPTSKLSIKTVGKDMDRSIVVHCNSGFGASLAARKLVELGYKNVRNAFGGNNMYQIKTKH